MRAQSTFLALWLVMSLTACGDAGTEPPVAALSPEGAANHTETTTVSDQELVDASHRGATVVNGSSSLQRQVADMEARASAAGIDLQNLSQSEQENLQDLLGYTDAQWGDLLSHMQQEVHWVTLDAPELTWDSYNAKAEEVTGGEGSRESTVYMTDVTAGGTNHRDDGRVYLRPWDDEIFRTANNAGGAAYGYFHTRPRELYSYVTRAGRAAECPATVDGHTLAWWGWPSKDCLVSAGWFAIATFGSAVAAASCGSGNALACVSMLGGAAAMVKTGSDMVNTCRSS